MNTDGLKLVCPKCGEEFSNAETIKIIDKIDSFRKAEEYKENIKSAEADIQRLNSEIVDLDNLTNEYAEKIDEHNNNPDKGEKITFYKEYIIDAQLKKFQKEEEIAKCKIAIKKSKEEMDTINNRFDIKEIFNTSNIISADNDYKDLKELLKNNNETIRFCAKLGFLETLYKGDVPVYELSPYHLSAMFNIGNKDSNIIFYEFKTQISNKIKIGIKYGKDDVDVSTEIENWINDISMPEDRDNYKFLLLPAEELNRNSLYPNHYAPKYSSIKEYLDTKDTANLSEIAEIIMPKIDYNKKGNVLKTDDYYSGISGAIDSIKNSLSDQGIPCERDHITDCILKKNDIVIAEYDNFTFLSEQPQKDIYANGYNHIVLRTKKGFSAEYLYNYLTSNIAHLLFGKIDRAIFNLYEQEENEELLNKLSEIPVILPKNDATDFDCSEFNETVNKFAKSK